MTILHLDGYLQHQKLVQTLPLSTLSDSRLGIDASHYLSALLAASAAKEPLVGATGGLPLALVPRLEDDLRALEKLRIKPVFVFPGLAPAKRRQHMNHAQSREHEDACRDRRDAWAKYEQGQEEAAFKLFEGRSGLTQEDLARPVLRVFRQRNVEFMFAPYLAWSQLIYLQRHQKSYIHAAYGSTDLLLYQGSDKLILSLDLASPTPTFTYVSKRALLADLGVTDDQFTDMGILCGFDHCPSFPPAPAEHAVIAIRDMVRLYKSGHGAVSTYADAHAVKQIQYADQYARARSLVRFSLILASEGLIQPLPLALPPGGPGQHHPTTADIPSDLHEIFTHRLPDELYFYLSRGLLSPAPLQWLTSGFVVERPPADNGETVEYRRFVREVITDGQTGPRATSLALISTVCAPFWANRKVLPIFWFDPPGQHPRDVRPIQHASPQTTQLAERVQGWLVPYSVIEEELRRQNSSTLDFSLCLGATSTDKLASRTRAKTNGPKVVLDKKDEIVANVIWRFLELRGFLLHTHTHAPLAMAMTAALKGARLNDKFQDPLFLFLELVRSGVMRGNLLSGRAFSGGPSFGTDDEKSSMLLVMRVLCVVPLNFKPQPWSAPLSRELLVFNSFVKSLTRALRTLLEVTTLNMLLRADARRARDDYLDISLSLPFQSEVNTGFGVLAKVYLDALTHINGGTRVRDADAEGVAETKQIALDICNETFPGVKNPAQEVERGFRFWDLALAAMRVLHAEGGVYQDLIDQFEAAEAWLRPMRP